MTINSFVFNYHILKRDGVGLDGMSQNITVVLERLEWDKTILDEAGKVKWYRSNSKVQGGILLVMYIILIRIQFDGFGKKQ